MKQVIKYTAVILFVLCTVAVQAQEQFAKEVAAFQKRDSIEQSPKNAIVFAGSSSFTKWTTVQSAFPTHTIINRGFGGSTLVDVIHYAEQAILMYEPKQVVIYCGENDLASSDTVKPQHVLQRFKTLFEVIRNRLPETQVSFISIKPSPSRQKLMPLMIEANELIKGFLDKQQNTAFIDIYDKMLAPDGTPNKDLFVADMLHMNLRGYAIWQAAIAPYLIQQ
jgi:lysophospholipase L1-like esterase